MAPRMDATSDTSKPNTQIMENDQGHDVHHATTFVEEADITDTTIGRQPLLVKRPRRRGRSRSAPARMREEKRPRRRLVDQHYKIDKEKGLLPGVHVQEDDLARDIHDFFNLIFLVPLVVLNVLNWNWEKMSSGKLKNGIQDAWHGEFFQPFFLATVLYFTIDLIWVCVFPKCVKSPGTIIQHHIATFAYLMVPYFYPDFRWAMGVCMSVEINTWFLIARRVFNRQGFPPWTIDLPYLISVRVKLISICFYCSWIFIRCILYPYMLKEYFDMLRIRMAANGNSFDILMVVLPIHLVFCALNARWTLDLINSKVRQFRLRSKTSVVESGL